MNPSDMRTDINDKTGSGVCHSFHSTCDIAYLQSRHRGHGELKGHNTWHNGHMCQYFSK